MIRISLPWVFNLATTLEPLESIKGGLSGFDLYFQLFLARTSIQSLMSESVFAPAIRTSRDIGNRLLAEIDKHIANTDFEKVLGDPDAASLALAYKNFKTIFLAEMDTLQTLFVTQKRGFDTYSLISWAEVIFPPDLPNKVPEAVADIRAAGKCLAFELPTAAGFHLHRANEAILHRYYDAATGGKDRPKSRNIGDYLKALNDHGAGSDSIKAALKDLKDLHRNPLIHPEHSLETLDEAIALLGGIQAVVAHMLKAIPVVLPAVIEDA